MSPKDMRGQDAEMVKPWLYGIYIAGCVLAMGIAVITCIDLAKSDLDEQLAGDPDVFPRWLYGLSITAFYLIGLCYGFIKWFFLGDVEPEVQTVEEYHMDWNMLTFFTASLMVFIFSMVKNFDYIFLFASVFTMQVCLVFLQIILAWFKKNT